jgi:hypothetical protein
MNLKQTKIYFGCDPEFFFQKDDEIIGAEKVLPENGIDVESRGKVIIDGIQAELNPCADTCRQVLGANISHLLYEVRRVMDEKKCLSSFKQTVSISEKEMESLSDKSKQFGCSQSFNVYQKDLTTGVKDGSKYFSRSGGGHIHIGLPMNTDIYSKTYQIFKKEPERIIRMLDIIVGNFCVMVDRDEGNKIRRKTYGRAGEHRIPDHGIEYRTLSNFWLSHYTLMSMAMSLTRFAVSIVCAKDDKLEHKILKAVDMEKVVRAINENDYDLARNNFDKIKKLITMDENIYYAYPPFTKDNIKAVEHFVSRVMTDGIEYWFKDELKDIIGHWIGYRLGRSVYVYRGWESFLLDIVKKNWEVNAKTLDK